MKTKYILNETDIKSAIAEWVAAHHKKSGPIPVNFVRLTAFKAEDDRGYSSGHTVTAEVEA